MPTHCVAGKAGKWRFGRPSSKDLANGLSDGFTISASLSMSELTFTRIRVCLHLCPLHPYKSKSGSPQFPRRRIGELLQPKQRLDFTSPFVTKPLANLTLQDFSLKKLHMLLPSAKMQHCLGGICPFAAVLFLHGVNKYVCYCMQTAT